MLACDKCELIDVSAVMPPLLEGHPSTSCCSAFHSSIVQVRRLRGEGTRRSVAGHGPVYSLVLCLRHLPVACETVLCISSGSIAYRWRVVKRVSLFLPRCLHISPLASCLSVSAMPRPRIRPLNPEKGQRTHTS